jgi:hypothetical protein
VVQTHERRYGRRRDIAIDVFASGLTGLKLAADVAGIPYVSPIVSLLRAVINIRNASVRLFTRWLSISRACLQEMAQYQVQSAVLAERLETIAAFLNDLGQGFRKGRDVPQPLRNIFQKFERYAIFS